MAGLGVCASCDRHRKIVESNEACPFCGAVALVSAEPRTLRERASRAALVFGGMALAATTSCVSKGDVYGGPPPPSPPSTPDGGVHAAAPAYGLPPHLAYPDAAKTSGPPAPPTTGSGSSSPSGPPRAPSK